MDESRLNKELEIVRKEYPSAMMGDNFSFIIIPDFPLPRGWNMDKTEFMLEIPAGYPVTPPDNFYVSEGLRVKTTGVAPASYGEGEEKFGKMWARFSWHIDGKWSTFAEPQDGDNLLTFILTARERLRRPE